MSKVEFGQRPISHFIKLWTIFIVLLALSGLAGVGNAEESGQAYISHRDGKPSPGLKGALDYLEANFSVRPGFSSHLPLLVIEPASQNFMALAEEGPAYMYLINSSEAENRLDGPRPPKYEVTLAPLDDDVQSGAKGSVSLKLAGGSRQGLLGLPPAGQWVLQGSSRDKGLLRNYLAYIWGGEIMPRATPLVRFCEVLIRNGDEYYYQGLYLLTQSVEDHLALAADKKAEEAFLLKYEAGGAPGGIFKARGAPPQATSGSLSLVYPRPGDNWDQLPAIAAQLGRVEAYLYSDQADLFFKYTEVLNIESFINTQILNGYLGNFMADGLPAYLYSEGGKLSLSPIWNFDQAMDNTIEPLNAGQASALRTLWLERLMNSKDYIKEYRKRYYQLYRGVLRPDRAVKLVDDVDIYLRPAMLRDWARWQQVYTDDKRFMLQPGQDDDGLPVIRQTLSYNQELVKIRHNLHINDVAIRNRLLDLQWVPGLITGVGRVKHDVLMVAIFLASFFSIVVYARKKMS